MRLSFVRMKDKSLITSSTLMASGAGDVIQVDYTSVTHHTDDKTIAIALVLQALPKILYETSLTFINTLKDIPKIPGLPDMISIVNGRMVIQGPVDVVDWFSQECARLPPKTVNITDGHDNDITIEGPEHILLLLVVRACINEIKSSIIPGVLQSVLKMSYT